MLTKVEAYGFPVLPLELPLDSEDSPIQIKDIQGLDPVKATITTLPLSQHELVTGTSVGKRNIVFKFGLNPNWEDQTSEGLRKLLHQYFMPQAQVALRFYSTHMATVQIGGFVESCDANIFSEDPEYQVSVICPKAPFQAVEPKNAVGVTTNWGGIGAGEGYSIGYEGTIPTGLYLRLASNPTVTEYEEQFRVTTIDPLLREFRFRGRVDSARIIELNSVYGEKYIRNNTPTTGLLRNLLSTMTNGSTWPVLYPGMNHFQVRAHTEGITWVMQYTELYGGI